MIIKMVESVKKLKKTSLILLFSMSVFIMTCGPLFVQAFELMGPIWASIYTDPLRYYDTSGYGEVQQQAIGTMQSVILLCQQAHRLVYIK